MILWTIKLLKEVRRAIAGRRFPGQLAWALAFGLLLGILPHDNLLAVALLIVVLSLKLNHAMAGLTAVGTSFLATWLDPYSHRLGDYVLTHPQISEAAAAAWRWPLVPWTDLNNTVVMGSFLIGLAALLPTFLISYPIFRAMTPRAGGEGSSPDPTPPGGDAARPDHRITAEGDHRQLAGPHRAAPAIAGAPAVADTPAVADKPAATDREQVAVETRIDVIRMEDYRSAAHGTGEPGGAEGDTAESGARDCSREEDDPGAMGEALRYLLRQLRDSQRKAA